MRFHGMDPLAPGFPHTELRAGAALFDVHNAGVLESMHVDFEARSFEVGWRVDNLLEDERVGPYRTARILLTIQGINGFSGSGELLTHPLEAAGIDFIEYLPGGERPGTMRFVFTSSGEISVSGTDCELRYAVLSPLP
jgi:hypothetical protein